MRKTANYSCLREAHTPVKPQSRQLVQGSWSRVVSPGSATLTRFYVNNRRDGSRLLSSALVICAVGLIRIDHPIGQAVALIAGLVSLYWWTCYRQLQR